MKIKLTILLGLILYNLPAISQNWVLSKQISSTANTQVWSFDLDKSKNLYVTGNLNGNTDIGAPYLLSKVGTSLNFYIVKYNDKGTYLWHKQLAGTGNINRGCVAVDSYDSLVFNAFYFNHCDSLSTIPSTYKSNVANVLISKYSSDGKLGWAKRVAWGPADVKSQYMTLDPNNNIYITGYSTDTIYFGTGNYISSSSGKVINFIAKFSPQGNFIHVTKIKYSSTDINSNKFIEITAPNENEIYVGGFFNDTVSYGSIKLYAGSSSAENALIAKINGSGSVEWMRMSGNPTGPDRCNGVTTDIYGNVYLTGYISGSAIFDSTDNGSQNSSALVGNGSNYDMMIAKYNKNGTLQWKRRNGSTGPDIGYGIYITNSILMYSGYYSGSVTFNGITLNSGSTSNTNTGFFVYDVNGNPVTAMDIQGNAADRGENITYDAKNGITYIGGYFSSTNLTIGSNVYDCGGTQDGFIAAYQNPLSVTFSKHVNLNCNGENNGVLIATPYFGAAPYTYTWSANVNNHADSLAYNLPAGTYSVTVTDSRDSTATTSITLTQPTAINIASTQTNVTCNPLNGGGNNGTINITVTGGTHSGAYSYNWTAISGSGSNATNEDQFTLAAGTYNVVVTDDNLCEATKNFTIGQPNPITFGQTIVSDETVPPTHNGAINLTVSGGTPAFTYKWAGPGGFSSVTEDVGGLVAGNYALTVTDSKSCSEDSTFLINNNTLLIAYISDKTDVDCKGTNTGSATVSVLQGTGPYTYKWKNNLGTTVDGSNPSVINLPADIYFVTVTDNSDGDSSVVSVQINEPADLFYSTIAGTDIDCYGNLSGVADLSVSGGTLPYTFSWSNGSTTEDIADLGIGSYFVTITDNKSCVIYNNVTLTQPPALDINAVIDQPVACFGELTGWATATATGGTGTKTYIWNDPGNQTAQTATYLGAGTYSVTATDLNGCKIIDDIVLTEPSALLLTATHQDVSCTGTPLGIINLTVNGGTPIYNYDWSNGQISQDISGLLPGNYRVIVTDAHNCIDSLAVDIIQSPGINIGNIAITDASCYGYSDGELDITASGGSGIYEYSTDGGSTYISSSNISGLTANNYTVIIRDNTGCESSDSVVTINQPAEIIFQNISLTAPTCYSGDDGSIELSASGGAGAPYQYSINNGTNFSVTSLFSNLAASEFQLVISDAAGCQTADSLVNLPSADSITLDSESSTNISCHGLSDGSIQIIINGVASNYQYSINNGLTYISNSGIFNDLQAGTYQVRVRDLNNCEKQGSTLIITDPEILRVDTTSLTHAIGEENGALEASTTGGTSPFTFILDQATADSITNHDGHFTNISPGNYILYAIDNNLCISDSLLLTIIQETTDLKLYDAFSPNDDGINDVWNIVNINLYPNCKVSIFNSWGNLVFTSDGYAEPWDGKYNGKLLPAGTYYYIINLGDGSGDKAGPVSIVR